MMAKISAALLLVSLLLAPIILSSSFCLPPSDIYFSPSVPYNHRFSLIPFLPIISTVHETESVPQWWEIKIVLVSNGEYLTKEKKTEYLGQYSYSLQWTGSMEPDEGDFIIYHEHSELLRWEAQEKAQSPNSTVTLSSDDFLEKPSFKFNCLLQREGKIHFDFLIKGISVPQNESKHKFNLILPVSKENTSQFSTENYNPHVYKGSNKILLNKEDIFNDSVKKRFAWSWQYRTWDRQKTPFYLAQSHDVEVDILIIPHYKKNEEEITSIKQIN